MSDFSMVFQEGGKGLGGDGETEWRSKSRDINLHGGKAQLRKHEGGKSSVVDLSRLYDS